jgi:uncharacterized protein (TIGR03118 family)
MGHSNPLKFNQVNLLSDIAQVAKFTDPNVINPWGIAVDCFTSTFFVANNGSNTLYQIDFKGNVLASISTPEAPDGIILNRTKGFHISNGIVSLPAKVIIVSESGTISGFNPDIDPLNAIVVVDAPEKVFKGVSITFDSSERPILLVANFSDGVVEKYNEDFHIISASTDDALFDIGYAPFNISTIGDYTFVSFAKQDDAKHDDVAGLGNGFIDIYNVDVESFRRFANRGPLNSPWALIPYKLDQEDRKILLVGNFGDGRINAFDFKTGVFISPLKDFFGNIVDIDGLWGLGLQCSAFFPCCKSCKRSKKNKIPNILFAAGINDEDDGLIGKLVPVNPFKCPCK